MTDSSKASETDPAQTNNGTVGFVILALMTIFVAIWMSREARQLAQDSRASLSEPLASRFAEYGPLEGFLENRWQLPDEPLLGFVEVPAGTFIMGSNPALDRQAFENERWSSGRRQGSVELAQYYISRYEVTIAQFAAFVEDTGYRVNEESLNGHPLWPVSSVSWPDALAYSRWLEAKLNDLNELPAALRSMFDRGAVLTLPDEAQWEKAARSDDGRIYPWGDNMIPGLATHGTNSRSIVGSIDCALCAYGLSDMSGNVWELTRSPLQDYPFNPGDDATDLSEDALFVMRGGSFNDPPSNVRAAIRGAVDPGVRSNTIGFRVVIAVL